MPVISFSQEIAFSQIGPNWYPHSPIANAEQKYYDEVIELLIETVERCVIPCRLMSYRIAGDGYKETLTPKTLIAELKGDNDSFSIDEWHDFIRIHSAKAGIEAYIQYNHLIEFFELKDVWPPKDSKLYSMLGFMTVDMVLNKWFRYEPKSDATAAKRKMMDDRNKLQNLLVNASNSELKRKSFTYYQSVDVYPNAITGKHSNPIDQKRYLGLPFTRKTEHSVKYFYLDSLIQFIKTNSLDPPSDSPLVTGYLNLALVEQSENKHPEKIINCRLKNQKRNAQCQKWINGRNPDVDSMPKAEIRKALINWANETKVENLWQSGFEDWWKVQTLISKKLGVRKRAKK